mmetsp:Transcript_99765/g.242590  ORF Transcript_99765/g.242590 Transcript_99765/m.242590 type:complete len:89 (+) Transcript_99765:101-367(+)
MMPDTSQILLLAGRSASCALQPNSRLFKFDAMVFQRCSIVLSLVNPSVSLRAWCDHVWCCGQSVAERLSMMKCTSAAKVRTILLDSVA